MRACELACALGIAVANRGEQVAVLEHVAVQMRQPVDDEEPDPERQVEEAVERRLEVRVAAAAVDEAVDARVEAHQRLVRRLERVELAGERVGVGRTPIREAIKRLALEDLVTIYPRRGTFVSEIEITDLAQISDVRLQLEGHAAYRAAQNATLEERDEAAALARELDELEPSNEALMRLDARIHRFVYRCSRNPYLESTLDRFLNLSLRIWFLVIDRLPHLDRNVFEHRELLAAIRDGDAERARELAGAHVETFEREIRTVL